MPLPLGFIAPCLPTKAPRPPTGEDFDDFDLAPV